MYCIPDILTVSHLSTPQEQEKEHTNVRAPGGGPESEARSLESGFEALLRPKSSSSAGKSLTLAASPTHPELTLHTTHFLYGKEEEEADSRVTCRVSDTSEGGLESCVQEVLRSKNVPPPARPLAIPAAEHGAD